MLRVTLRGFGLPTVTLGSGETLLFGRSPHFAVPGDDPEGALRVTAIALPRCAPHVSRLLGELTVGEEIARLRWHGAGETQVSSLFDAPGGARRVTLTEGMSLLLDEGENQLLVVRGRQTGATTYDDLGIVVEVTPSEPAPRRSPVRPGRRRARPGGGALRRGRGARPAWPHVDRAGSSLGRGGAPVSAGQRVAAGRQAWAAALLALGAVTLATAWSHWLPTLILVLAAVVPLLALLQVCRGRSPRSRSSSCWCWRRTCSAPVPAPDWSRRSSTPCRGC